MNSTWTIITIDGEQYDIRAWVPDNTTAIQSSEIEDVLGAYDENEGYYVSGQDIYEGMILSGNIADEYLVFDDNPDVRYTTIDLVYNRHNAVDKYGNGFITH